MRPRTWWISAACAGACCTVAAQYRDDDQAVMERPPAPLIATPPDVVPRFAQVYQRLGQPRIMLMWNRALNDKPSDRVVDEQVTRERSRRSDSSNERLTQGPAETARLKEGDVSTERLTTVTIGKRTVHEPERQVKLAERHLLMLQRGFAAEMNRGGVRFVDRALAMRTTAASRQRQGGDEKLLETDALLSHADLLLEVLMVEDAQAPAGYSFDVRAKDIRRGQEIATLYSRAVPVPRAIGAGRWVPGPAGYEFRNPPAPPAPTPAEVGAALARDVMRVLGGNLSGPALRSRRRS